MSEPKSINLKVPSILWPAAVITSALLAILEAVGLVHAPWFVALLPIALVIGFGLSILVAAFVALIVMAGVVGLIELFSRPKKSKLATRVPPVRRIR